MSVETKDFIDFTAPTKLEKHEIPTKGFLSGILPVGLDIGYSATKTYGLYGKHIFPSFLKKMPSDTHMIEKDADIRYKDENGDIWYVGNLAREISEGEDAISDERVLFNRARIKSDEYLVLMRLGVFFSLVKDVEDFNFEIDKNKKIVIQTGLPDEYLNKDKQTLKDAFTGHHKFKVKVGPRPWVDVSFDVDGENIYIMSQPFGTLWSLVSNKEGDIVNPDLLYDNVLIVDGGFHTVDTYYSEKGYEGHSVTRKDISMFEVFKRTKDDIRKKTNDKLDIKVYEIDKAILNKKAPGKIEAFPNTRDPYISVDGFLSENAESVAKEAAKRIALAYDDLANIDHLILTGGTGKAYFSEIKRYFKYKDVLLAERSDSSDPADNFNSVFANVTGFFYCLMANLTQQKEDKTGLFKSFDEEKAISEATKDALIAASEKEDDVDGI